MRVRRLGARGARRTVLGARHVGTGRSARRRWALRTQALGARQARGAQAAWARGRSDTGAQSVRGTAGWAVWARPGRAAGQTGYALGALSQF